MFCLVSRSPLFILLFIDWLQLVPPQFMQTFPIQTITRIVSHSHLVFVAAQSSLSLTPLICPTALTGTAKVVNLFLQAKVGSIRNLSPLELSSCPALQKPWLPN